MASCKHDLHGEDPSRSDEDGHHSAQRAMHHDRTEQHALQSRVFPPHQGISARVTGNTQKYFHSLRSAVFPVSSMLTELAGSKVWLVAVFLTERVRPHGPSWPTLTCSVSRPILSGRANDAVPTVFSRWETSINRSAAAHFVE